MAGVVKKTIGVVCSTYRNPDKDALVRLYGVVSLFDQMSKQKFNGDIKIALVDDSPEPHPFYEAIKEKFKDTLVYIHVPKRDNSGVNSLFLPSDDVLAAAYQQDILERIKAGEKIFTPELKLVRKDFALTALEWDQIVGKKEGTEISDIERNSLETTIKADTRDEVVFWKSRLQEMRGFAALIPFEESYPIQTNIFAQIFQPRPTIGMKKNLGVAALEERFGNLDAFVFCDDDDMHSPDYVQKSIDALQGHGFTRMTKYLTHVFTDDPAKRLWGEYDLPMKQDATGYWVPAVKGAGSTIICANGDGTTSERKLISGDLSRLIPLVWPIISHEGALHTYSGETWRKSLDVSGGFPPVSFSEDIIYFRMLKDHFGTEFKAVVTPVDEPCFLRMADGNNASMIYWMKNMTASDVPAWAKESLVLLESAMKARKEAHPDILKRLGQAYCLTGEIDLSAFQGSPSQNMNPPRKLPGVSL